MDGTVTICSVGDLMICDSPLYASVGVGSEYQGIKEELFSNCIDAFKSADIVIGNFETIVHDPLNKSLAEMQMCCPDEVIGKLREVGFSILNIANNHSMQHGIEGFNRTKQVCKSEDIQPIGIRDEEPCFVEINGVRLAFLSLCIHLEWYEPDRILYEDRIDRILNAVQELRKNDGKLVIIVAVHWGDEFAAYPSNAQIALAHRFVELGASIILGHHSHIFQGIEQYKGAVIAYSQGNFISDMVPEFCRQTGIVKIGIEQADEIRLSYELIPYEIEKDYIPCPANGQWIADRQDSLAEALNGQYSDDEYWGHVSKNHLKAHDDFKRFFKTHILDYKLSISSRMILEFVGRKVQRILGRTSDGRVSSMDSEILAVLKRVDMDA